MTRRILLTFIIFIILSVIFSCNTSQGHFFNSLFYSDLPVDTINIPEKNKAILKYAELNGPKIAPTYDSVVCTEYVVKILEHFIPLTFDQKKKINIVTKENLDTLLAKNSPIIKGVYYSLISTNVGYAIDTLEKVKAGDFVQFWDNYNGKVFGHCAIVRALDLNKGLLSVYSSSRRTNGHGKQLFRMPEKMFFVRLK